MSEYIVSMSGDWASKQGEKLTEIIRCRDCKHYGKTLNDVGICHPLGIAFADMDDGYCAWGEREGGAR